MKPIYIVLAIVILVLQIRLLSSEGGVGEYISLKKQLNTLETKISNLESHNTALKKEVQALQSNTDSIETIARQKLGMIGENEVFIKVIELPSTQINSGQVIQKSDDSESSETNNLPLNNTSTK